jgi:hypothetical protein
MTIQETLTKLPSLGTPGEGREGAINCSTVLAELGVTKGYKRWRF